MYSIEGEKYNLIFFKIFLKKLYIKQKKFSIDELKDSWGRLRLDKYLSSNLSYLELKDNII